MDKMLWKLVLWIDEQCRWQGHNVVHDYGTHTRKRSGRVTCTTKRINYLGQETFNYSIRLLWRLSLKIWYVEYYLLREHVDYIPKIKVGLSLV